MTLAEPFVKRWTREEFYQLGELGCFHGKPQATIAVSNLFPARPAGKTF
jgi:hypothetical protein